VPGLNDSSIVEVIGVRHNFTKPENDSPKLRSQNNHATSNHYLAYRPLILRVEEHGALEYEN
jgi:hypothetical protein